MREQPEPPGKTPPRGRAEYPDTFPAPRLRSDRLGEWRRSTVASCLPRPRRLSPPRSALPKRMALIASWSECSPPESPARHPTPILTPTKPSTSAEGQATFLLGDRELAVEPGSVVVVPRGMPHTVRNSGEDAVRGLIIISPGDAEHVFIPVDAGKAARLRAGVVRRLRGNEPDGRNAASGPPPPCMG